MCLWSCSSLLVWTRTCQDLLIFVNKCSVFYLQVNSASSHTLLQSPIDSHDVSTSCHWLEDSGCQSLSSAYIPPPPSSPFYSSLTPPPTCLLSSTPGWNSYYDNCYPSPCSSSGDWLSPGSQSRRRGGAAGELSTCM